MVGGIKMDGNIQVLCKKVRRNIINMTSNAGCGHPGGSLSIVEVLVALYFEKMNIDPQNPNMQERDRFVLSKGHAAPALYSVLAERGFFDTREFERFRQLGSILQGHPDMKRCPGVDASTGSLGQGISTAVGMAIAAKTQKNNCHIYTIIGDGESQEGLVWEASMAAAHYKLDNLTVIFDHNGLQIDGSNDEVMSLGDIAAKFTSFGYDVVEVPVGNDYDEVLKALNLPNKPGIPKLIHLHTVKGKGVSFMENNADWHGKAPNASQREQALSELV